MQIGRGWSSPLSSNSTSAAWSLLVWRANRCLIDGGGNDIQPTAFTVVGPIS